ncbi:hypothetical protein BDZ88DRAFT_328162 [Geranomyces variabilis]|nr:hypothetical protein BDZ88DRAFT_328162 [Geranomyces variabilis]KAJ3139843.1 hypothetical protein HDU90_008741 [Geranomyces variabilis]
MTAVRQRPDSLKRDDAEASPSGSPNTTPRNGTTPVRGLDSLVPSTTTTYGNSARYSLLDFPPGISPSPLPTIAETPNRFLQKTAKLDLEPNPFEFSFSGQQGGSSQPSSHSAGYGTSPSAILPPLQPTPRNLESFTFKTGLTPGPGGLGMLTPLSATLASLGLPISNTSSIPFPDGASMGGVPRPRPEDSRIPYGTDAYRLMPMAHGSNALPPHYDYRGPPNVPGPVHGGAPMDSMRIGPPTYAPGLPAAQTVNPNIYGAPPQRHPYVDSLANGLDPLSSNANPFPPHSPQAAAVALLGMRRDGDKGYRESSEIRSEWQAPRAESQTPLTESSPPTTSSRSKRKKRSDEDSNGGDTPAPKPKRKAAAPKVKGEKAGTPAKARRSATEEKEGEEDDLDTEEKRKTFLERNRQAALKCRQKKKQWLQSLQAKVDYLTSDNEGLQSQATQLREEILNLKTLLLAHRDCPIAKQNGLNLNAIESILPVPTQPYAHRMY